jgi:hypothetical protein
MFLRATGGETVSNMLGSILDRWEAKSTTRESAAAEIKKGFASNRGGLGAFMKLTAMLKICRMPLQNQCIRCNSLLTANSVGLSSKLLQRMVSWYGLLWPKRSLECLTSCFHIRVTFDR